MYRKDKNRRGSAEHESFTFLGFTFRARSAWNKHGVIFVSFLPAPSREALKAMGQRVRRWRIHLHISSDLADLARWIPSCEAGYSITDGSTAPACIRSCTHQNLSGAVARKKYKRLHGFKKAKAWWDVVCDRKLRRMSALQIVALVICFAVTVVAVALFARMIGRFIATFKVGQPDSGRTNDPASRTMTLVREFLGHTRMARKPDVAVAHWFVMVSFGLLFFTLLTAYGQLFDLHFALPLIGRFFLYEWATELISWASFVGILVLMVIRQKNHPPLPRPAQSLLRLHVLAGLLRRADHPRRRHLHPDVARFGIRPRQRAGQMVGDRSALPFDAFHRKSLLRYVDRWP